MLQLLDRSPLAELVSRVVLDGPVIDWGDVLAHHARGHRLPRHVGSLARAMMRQRWGHRLVGMPAWKGALPTLYAATMDVPGNTYLGPDGVRGMRGWPGSAVRSPAAQRSAAGVS